MKNLIKILMFSCLFLLVSSTYALAYDPPSGACKDIYASSNKKDVRNNLKNFDVIFIGELVDAFYLDKNTDKKHGSDKYYNHKRKNENFHLSFKVDEMFKNKSSQDISNSETIKLFSGSAGGEWTEMGGWIKGTCRDTIGYASKGKKVLIFAKKEKGQQFPVVWRVSFLKDMNTDFYKNLKKESDLVFVGNVIKEKWDGTMDKFLAGNKLTISKVIKSDNLFNLLRIYLLHDNRNLKTSYYKENNADYIVYASKQEANSKYLEKGSSYKAKHIELYLDKEIIMLRELSKTLIQKWNEL